MGITPARKVNTSAPPTPPKVFSSVEEATPSEEGGPIARIGFNYQDEIAVGYLLDMLEDSSILKVHCETHDDVILVSQGSSTRVVAEYADVIDMPYTDNKLHPTQRSVQALAPLVRSFTLPGELVLDPFAGSGSTCATAKLCGR